MAHMIETMAYAGEVPWHGLGTKVVPTLSPEEMANEAGLNWTVKKEPIQTTGGILIPDKYAIVREQDKTVLSICSEIYKPVQNADAIGFFKRFVEAGRMTMETAGSLDNGKRIWGLARMKTTDFALANDDKVEGYLLLCQPHVPGQALTIMFTPIRVVCHNTLTYALQGANGKGVFRMPHTIQFTEEVKNKAIEVLGLSTERMKEFKETAEFLRGKRATDKMTEQYFIDLFQAKDELELGNREMYNRSVTSLLDIVDKQPGAAMARGTWWNAFNAVTYYLDHRHGNTQNVRVRSAWFGHGAAVKHRALNLAVDMAKKARAA